MKKIFIFLFFITLSSYSQSFDYERTWATYFGDDSIRITATDIDNNGNIFLVGFVNRLYFSPEDSNFTTTTSSHQPNFGGGVSDGFIVKINPNGTIAWSTFFGGENADSITSIKIDNNNDLCILGQTSSTQNIATTTAYQTSTIGTSSFLSKFSNNGALIWSTYYDNYLSTSNVIPYEDLNYGNNYLDVDSLNNIYFAIKTANEGLATSDAYQTIKNQPNGANLVSKFTSTGQRVWATYYGVNASTIFGFCIGNDGLYFSGTTLDCAPVYTANTFFATSGCHQPLPGSCRDIFLSKFSLDGDRIWSTYYGNNFPEKINDNSIVAFGDNVYLTATSFNQGGLTTPGSFQETNPITVGQENVFLVKFNSVGVRQWGTFYGHDGIAARFSRVSKDSNGNIFLSGSTDYLQNISSTGSFQEVKNNSFDAFVAKFSPAGERQWGTYYGGNGYERENIKPLIYNNSFYITGSTDSMDNIATTDSFQPTYATNNYQSPWPSNFFMAKFDPLPLSINQNNENQFALYPNPTNGVLNIVYQNDIEQIEVYSIDGKKIKFSIQYGLQQAQLDASALAKGIYILVLTDKDNKVQKQKFVKE